MERVQPKEIRIALEGGLVQSVGIGRDVPKDITITVTDFDLDGQTSEDDPRIEDAGYGDLAFCQILFEPGDTIKKDTIDEDGTAWL